MMQNVSTRTWQKASSTRIRRTISSFSAGPSRKPRSTTRDTQW